MAGLSAYALSYFGAWLLTVAGIAKLRAPAAYRSAMAAYLGRAVNTAAVRAVGSCELLLGLALLLPATRSAAGFGAALLLCLYALAMARQLYGGAADMRCGCSGAASQTRVAPALVVRNLLLVAAMLWVALTLHSAAALPPGLWLLSGACALLLVFIYLSVEQIIANRQYLEEWD